MYKNIEIWMILTARAKYGHALLVIIEVDSNIYDLVDFYCSCYDKLLTILFEELCGRHNLNVPFILPICLIREKHSFSSWIFEHKVSVYVKRLLSLLLNLASLSICICVRDPWCIFLDLLRWREVCLCEKPAIYHFNFWYFVEVQEIW